MPKALLPIFLIVVVDILGMTIIMPLLPFYAEHMGASPTQVGMLVSIFAVCQLIGGPLLGRWSDYTGRKPLLLLSQAGTLLGFVILAYANSLWMVYLSRVIDGFTAGNISLAQAYIADVTKPEERTKSFAVIGIAFGIGFLVGPAISGFLAHWSIRYPMYAAMALSGASILTTWWLLPALKPEATSAEARRLSVLDWGTYVRYFRTPELAPYLWQFLAFVFAFSTFMSGFPLFAERRMVWNGRPWGPREVGYIYAYVGFLGILLQGALIGRLARAIGDRRLVLWGFLTAAAGFTILGWTWQLSTLLMLSLLVSFGTGVLRPALTSLITQSAGRAEQGGVLGLTQSLQSVAAIAAPFLSGVLIEHGLLSGWALMAAAAMALGLLGRRPAPPLQSEREPPSRSR